MKTYSLRRSVLLVFLPALLLAVAVMLGASVISAHRAIMATSDDEMEHLADMLHILTRHEALEGEDIALTLGGKTEQAHALSSEQVAFRVWGGGRIIVMSAYGGASAFPGRYGTEGFHNEQIRDRRWRILTRIDRDNDIVVEVAQDLAERAGMVRDVTNSLIWPLMILLPIVLVVILAGLQRVLGPVHTLSRDLNQRDAGNLEPVMPARLPIEVLPLIQAMNSLFRRMQDSLNREREFTDNAAHELRTPLAALKTRAQVLAGEIGPRAKGRESLNELLAIVDRTAGLVDQLLTLAHRRAIAPVVCDLSEIAIETLAEVGGEESAAGHTITKDISDSIHVAADAQSVRILIRNLLVNAITHTPPGTSIHCVLRHDGDRAWLTVSDTGPGISAGHRERVLRRFTRLDSRTAGSGLGLAIVADICAQIGAELTLGDNPPHGLRVEIRFAANL